MKELNRKTFLIIFFLLSSFLFISIITVNIFAYRREYIGIEDSLKRIEQRDNNFFDSRKMLFMDNNVYLVLVNSQDDYEIISNSNENIDDIVKKIISTNTSGTKIGNLYFSKYSYNYKYQNILLIVNNSSTNNRLWLLLIKTLLLTFIFELIIYLFSIKITDWITKPVLDSFNKQKEFIADASHELKTPLAVIMASADEMVVNKKNIKYIDNIKHEADRMNLLIKSMLDLSKLENNSMNNFKENNLSKIVEKTCLVFDSIAYENNLKIITDIDKDIIMKCNNEDIERLVSILVDNAIKHAKEKTIINVYLNKYKNIINLKVINVGDPINTGDEEKIFERFYRGDKSRNRESNRYGLGLAIAKKITENHKGVIKAKSEDGKTEFNVCFHI